ncbi:MAG TPA: DegV family protein [Bacteroidales bacterium]|nr:DegV family protein [Bacteroidales bacterium]HPT08910.1 DegV family protein [Bacteroidales bacterium]
MTEKNNSIKELDGKQLYHSFIAGAQRIFEQQKLLNKINVFPVADADTGTNLASTMRSIMDAIIPTDNLKQTAVALADAALIGARGNSGIIFAQFLYGFSNEIQSDRTLDVESFATSMKKAVAYAYDAIANPIEGTILTVIKDWADYIYQLKDRFDDFILLLVEAYKKALESLAATTRRLEVLARSHVVDAGAKGFVFWLEGIKDFFTLGEAKSIIHSSALAGAEEEKVEMPHEEITFRFCTEALINGNEMDKHKIRTFIQHCGDSLVVAGTPQKIRVHIHTDFPAEVFSQLQQFGHITYQKVDDMVMQNEIQFNRKSDVALLTDSTCDLPKELIDHYQIHVVPLTLHFGETYFLDRLTINPPQFYSMMARTEERPTTAQPASKEFQNKYEFLATHYESIIGLHITHGMSGTFSSSDKGAQDVRERTGKKIDVINSRNITGGLGLILLRIAEAIEKGATHEEILSRMDEWLSKSMIRVSVPTLRYIVRSGRVSPFKSFVAKALDINPVIALDRDGKAIIRQKSFSEKTSRKKIIKDLEGIVRKNPVWGYAITHANNPEAAAFYATEMERITGRKPLYNDHASPVLVANVGPGVACVALLLE